MIILSRRGVFLPRHRRETLSAPMRRIAAPAQLFVPLFLSGGGEAEQTLCPPCRVEAFDVLARLASGFCFVAPCAGEWMGVQTCERGKYAVIEPCESGEKEHAPFRALRDKADAGEIIARAARAGIVDDRGRALCELLCAAKGRVETVYADCIEDEPYGTVKTQLLREAPAAIAGGLRLAAQAIGASVGDVKVCASLVFGVPKKADGLRVERIYGEYPVRLRAEKRLKQEKGLLLDAAALMALYAACRGKPEARIYVTVAGEQVGNECIVSVLPGTPVRELLLECGGEEKPECLVLGDAMTGQNAALDDPVTGSTRVLLAFKEDYHPVQYCINCGRCTESCPQKIYPADIVRAGERGDFRTARLFGADRCFACGVCDYVCPMGIDVSRAVREAAKRSAEPKPDDSSSGFSQAADRPIKGECERGEQQNA